MSSCGTNIIPSTSRSMDSLTSMLILQFNAEIHWHYSLRTSRSMHTVQSLSDSRRVDVGENVRSQCEYTYNVCIHYNSTSPLRRRTGSRTALRPMSAGIYSPSELASEFLNFLSLEARPPKTQGQNLWTKADSSYIQEI